MSQHESAIKYLEDFARVLPRDHEDRRGVLRSIEILRHAPAERALNTRLQWHRGGLSGQHYADHEETGLHFVITRIDLRSDGQRGFAYEIETSERGGRIRLEDGIMRFDAAKARCLTKVQQRLTGEDA